MLPLEGRSASLVAGGDGLEVNDALHAAALDAAERDASGVWEAPGGPVFLRVYAPPARLVVVGAVHVAQPLAAMARAAGLAVVVVDPREAFATEERFPGVRLLRSWPDEALEVLAPDRRTAVVTLTHDPKLDDPGLSAALRSPAFYVGALGSRRTHARRLDRLRESGLGEDALRRIHGPVGLDVGARTPGEIAVSILAEVVATLRSARR
jgi:xanthine dehydrogenase accessory factor